MQFNLPLGQIRDRSISGFRVTNTDVISISDIWLNSYSSFTVCNNAFAIYFHNM